MKGKYMDKRWINILETYRCLIDNIKNFPGAKLEDAFSQSALQSFIEEHQFLKEEMTKMLKEEKT
jgi:hypothetical protein